MALDIMVEGSSSFLLQHAMIMEHNAFISEVLPFFFYYGL